MDMTVDTVKNVTGVIAASVPVPILVAIVVVVISTILMLLVLLLGQSTRKTLLLCGITNSGKTLMFVELAVGHSVKTVTSMKENVHEIAIPGFPVQLVEIPGSDRIRKTILDNYLKKEDVPYMIFVVDSSSFMKECREVAEFLYDILSTKEVVKRGKRFSLLIACSKQDIPTAKSSQVIKTYLEREFTILSSTRAAALDTTVVAGVSSDLNRKHLLSQPGHDFSFSDLPQKITFCDCSCRPKESSDDCGLSSVYDWLKKL